MPPTSTSADQAAPVRSVLLIVAATLTFSGMDTIVKLLVTEGMSPFFVAWMRYVFQCAAAILFLRANRNLFRIGKGWQQLLRGVCILVSTVLGYYALRTLSLAEMTAIFYFGPLLVTALAGPLLGETIGPRRWAAVLIGFAGVMIVVRPSFDSISQGQLLAISGMVAYSVYILLTRSLSPSETSESLLFYGAFIPAAAILLVQPFDGLMPSAPRHWILLLALGGLGALGHWCFVLAYRAATTSALAPYSYLHLVWNFIMGYLVFAQSPDPWTFVGSAIIVGSGLYILHRERRTRLARPPAETG